MTGGLTWVIKYLSYLSTALVLSKICIYYQHSRHVYHQVRRLFNPSCRSCADVCPTLPYYRKFH